MESATAPTTAVNSPAHTRPAPSQGASEEDAHFQITSCSLGYVLIAATTRGICRISLGDEPEALVLELGRRFPHANEAASEGAKPWTVAALAHVEGQKVAGSELPLDLRGTAFQERVWEALRRVPAGQTRSYAQLARQAGYPRAVRAVANACGDNPIAVVIPCHRIVRSDGGLGGYRWGIERKVQLLEREAALRPPAATSCPAQ